MKKILFISAADFKEKSIQVIRKTPEAYASAGWKVDYIVARDNCPNGNYSYEKEVNPEGVNVTRFYWPFPKLRSHLPRFLSLIFSKIMLVILLGKLMNKSIKAIRKNKYDVIYGFGGHGILSIGLLKFIGYTKNSKIVSRILGTHLLWEIIKNKSYMRLLFNWDLVVAIKMKTDLFIMTNDGTQGNKVIDFFNKTKKKRYVFWVNGVDNVDSNHLKIENIIKKYNLLNKKVFISVSRLVKGKGIDRGIYIIKELRDKGINNMKYLIVGEGDLKEKLQNLVMELQLEDCVSFVGAVNNNLIQEYLHCADFFISMYDSSNVGNPLLEAIRSNKFIVTINTGDTGNWIQHRTNGLIYDISQKNIYNNIATDIIHYIINKSEYEKVITNIQITEKNRLWTWKQRLDLEVNTVSELI